MDAWNRGDLEQALFYYWDSPDMTWVNRKGISFGREEFAAAMRSEFADRSTMGSYTSKILQSKELNPDAVLLVLDWSIREGSGKQLMGGISSQIWQRFSDGWKAVFEHAS